MIANSLAKGSTLYLSDDRLVAEAKSGNRRAFGELCLRYNGMLRQRILTIVRHREDAEDVLQDTFLSAYQHLDGFRGTCRFSTWLLTIGTNRSLMLLRKRKVLLKHISDAVSEDGETLAMECRDPALNPEQRYMMHQTCEKLDDAIKNLSPKLRSVVELYYRRELRLKDAAEVIGISEVATKSRILSARRTLRRSLKKNECWTP